MSLRRRILWASAVVTVGLFGLWLSTQRVGSAGSTLSAESSGWLVAKRVVERSVEARITDRPTEAHDGVLALIFPWQRRLGQGETDRLADHLREGGVVLLGYSKGTFQPQEEAIFDLLRLRGKEIGEDPPLIPWHWSKAQKARWTLRPSDEWLGDAPPVELPALRRLVVAPEDADVLYYGPGDEPVVFTYSTQGGRVVVLPSVLFTNAEILSARNADLLATLAEWLDRPWIFDEYHHGLIASDLIVEGKTGFAWDLFILHLFVIYGLALWALARRFGPAWAEQPIRAGSAASFLRNLGALHRRLGHHGEVARHLVERAVRLDPRLAPLQKDLLRQAETVSDDATLLRLAEAVSNRSPLSASLPTSSSSSSSPAT